MSRDIAIEQYCRAINKELDLPRKRKQELLTGIRRELIEHFSDLDTLEETDLKKEIGPIDEIASTLMETVSPEEQRRYRTRKKRLTIGVIAGLVILLLALFGWFLHWKSIQVPQPAYEVETIIRPDIVLDPEIYEKWQEETFSNMPGNWKK